MEWWQTIIGSGARGVRDLEEMGYPLHTAKKIESGELPMDPASQRARAVEQGFKPDDFLYHGTAGERDIRQWNEDLLGSRDPGDLGRALYTSPSEYLAGRYADMASAQTGLPPNVMKLIAATDARDIPIHEKIAQQGRLKAGALDEYLNAADMIRYESELTGKTGTSVVDQWGKTTETAHYRPSNVRKPEAAFDPENRDRNYVMGFASGTGSAAGGTGASYLADKFVDEDFGEDTSGTTPNNVWDQISGIPEEIWNSMPMRDKVALVTSFIPVVGTATGVYADVMNMVENEDERNALNAVLLASNFIPGNKVAELATKMGITDLYEKTGLGKPRTKEEVEATKDPRFGEVVQTQKAGEVQVTRPMEEITATGKVSNPILEEMRAGAYGDRVSKPQQSKLEKQAQANPVFEQQQLARSGGTKTTSEHDLYSQQANWEQMIGNPMIILPADMTHIRRVDQIGGVKVEPFHTQGGGAHADYTGKWRSEEDAARAKQAHANRVREETGKDPIMIYTPMQHAGSNFSTMGSEGVLHYLDAVGDMPLEGRVALDKYMRGLNQNVSDFKGIPDAYPGYENPEQMLWWLTNPEARKAGTPSLGNRRKAFMQAMSVKDMMQYGAPDINDVYSAINEASLHNLPPRMSGGKAIISADVNPRDLPYNPEMHRSYSTDIASKGAVTMDVKDYTPTEIIFPNMAAARADKAPAQRYRSMQTAGGKDDYQMADEEWYEGVIRWQEQQRRK